MKCKLRLYIADSSIGSVRVKRQLQEILNELDSRNYELEVIDIKQNPYIAERDKISVIPTMVKVAPFPIKRAIGDISDPEPFLEWLGCCYELELNNYSNLN